MTKVAFREMARQTYDQRWEAEWNDMKSYGPYARHLRRIVLEMIAPLTFSTVLDVGCGQGALLADLRRAFPQSHLCGTDFSLSSLMLTRGALGGIDVCVMDLTKHSFRSRFDLVICTDVLEHIEDDQSAIKSLAQLSSGYVLIATVQGRMRPHEPDAWGHVRNYGYGELVRKLEQHDLRPIQIVEWGYPFFSPLYRDADAALGGRGTGGQYGVFRKTLAEAIFQLYRLNSTKRGDEIFILAESTCKE